MKTLSHFGVPAGSNAKPAQGSAFSGVRTRQWKQPPPLPSHRKRQDSLPTRVFAVGGTGGPGGLREPPPLPPPLPRSHLGVVALGRSALPARQQFRFSDNDASISSSVHSAGSSKAARAAPKKSTVGVAAESRHLQRLQRARSLNDGDRSRVAGGGKQPAERQRTAREKPQRGKRRQKRRPKAATGKVGSVDMGRMSTEKPPLKSSFARDVAAASPPRSRGRQRLANDTAAVSPWDEEEITPDSESLDDILVVAPVADVARLQLGEDGASRNLVAHSTSRVRCGMSNPFSTSLAGSPGDASLPGIDSQELQHARVVAQSVSAPQRP